MRKFAALFFLCIFSLPFAWNPDLQTIEEQPSHTGFKQLYDLQSAARPEYSAYVFAGIIYLPLPSQSALQTDWGVHDGFAFRQRLGMWLTNNFDGKSPMGLTLGFAWFGERNGWDNEDFLFLPHRGEFSQINQVHSFGLSIADSSKHLLFGGGLQHINAKSDELRWWLLGTYRRFSALPVFYKSELLFLNLQINLQARELLGNPDSWQNYLPDLHFSFYSKDSLKVFISQNLFKQKFYAEGAFWASGNSLSWAAIKYYPDPSRLLIALEATATKKENDEIYFGAGITLPFLRVAYNSASDYENFFKSRGVWIAEFLLSIGTSGDYFFGLSAPKSAATETKKIQPQPKKAENKVEN